MNHMPTVLTDRGALSERAFQFLRSHAFVVEVDLGPDDETCRARLDQVFNGHDDRHITYLRQLQERYSGLSYHSTYLREIIFFAPILDPEPGDECVEFLYAIHPTTASCTGGSVLADGTVIIGRDGDEEIARFASLDHFIENDASLAEAAHKQTA